MTPPVITFEEPPEFPKRRYLLDGEVVPSVTTVLDVLAKPALTWWGQTIGVQGVCHLHELGVEIPWGDPAGVTKLLTEHRITVNHQRDAAATRGRSIHDALEAWAQHGTVPRLSDFPTEDRGYVQALAAAVMELRPECEATEVMVGSSVHKFAGRYDLRCRIDGALVRLDLKTGRRIYTEALVQLAAYELAAVEVGEEPSDRRLILRLGEDGSHEVAESFATGDMFLGILAAYNALQELKASKPKKPRKAKVAA